MNSSDNPAAAAVAYRERMNMPVMPSQTEMAQPEAPRAYFVDLLSHYRTTSFLFPPSTDPVCAKADDDKIS